MRLSLAICLTCSMLLSGGCAATPPAQQSGAARSANNPAIRYVRAMLPERNYRPGFAGGDDVQPSLPAILKFYGEFAEIKDLILAERFEQAQTQIARLQKWNLPLERKNLDRLAALMPLAAEYRDKGSNAPARGSRQSGNTK